MKKKGNVSLMVLLVLVACSLLGLLTVHFLKSMFTQYTQISSYYKTYYLAKAGVELSLAQVKGRGVGFSLHLGSGDALLAQNFVSSGAYGFDSSVLGKSQQLSRSVWQDAGCTEPFLLEKGESLVIPLFFDDFTGSVVESFGTGVVYKNKSALLEQFTLSGNEFPGSVSLGLLVASGTELYQTGMVFMTGELQSDIFKKFTNKIGSIFPTLEDLSLLNWKISPELQNYFVLANTSDHQLSFCLLLPAGESLPMQQYGIKSLGVYGGQKLGLEAVYKQPIPSFLIEAGLLSE